MQINSKWHLTYCTNIHPGESWEEVKAGLHTYLPEIKACVSPENALGIGLRLSALAVEELQNPDALSAFKKWLREHDLYVFTMNGFPYGGFHRQVVKDAVHEPDWTSPKRLAYTQLLFDTLAELLPEGIEGGISTSPLSYKPWHRGLKNRTEYAFEQATKHLLVMLDYLIEQEEKTGKFMHLDIEPEPDGLLENTREVLDYFQDWLLPKGIEYLHRSKALTAHEAERLIKRHIQICYDVCHFAVAFEDHREALSRFQEAGIQIGKFQISSALKADFREQDDLDLLNALAPFNESTYLHQVMELKQTHQFVQYPDLPLALDLYEPERIEEWRVHFHVPIFMEEYGVLASTQSDILEVFQLLKEYSYSSHLEVETYTWDVLPKDLQVDLTSSIERELKWVKTHLLE